jgi:regulator of protease activity HflC (stomatin/prohibitin superfamily)
MTDPLPTTASSEPQPITEPAAPATAQQQAAARAAVASTLAAPQLVQLRVPLEDVAEVMSTPDAEGRLPIVVQPSHALRIRNELVVAGVIVLALGVLLNLDIFVRGTFMTVAGVLIVLGVFRSFLVQVPMGAQAVLLRRGQFYKTIGPGTKIVPPWVPVSHIVTTRETPFDAPAMAIPTKDNVRTSVDMILTFSITAPEKFVFTISATDFDQVCQATCQESVRLLIRDKDSDQVLDITDADNQRLRATIGAVLEQYGVTVVRVVVTHVLPPIEFIASREARRLAGVQRAEEVEQHALEMLRQADREELQRQEIGARRQQIELAAQNEVARLERLEARLREYPNALRWDVESQRLEVARALAANTRAMVQVGPGVDVAGALLMHTLPDEASDGKTKTPATSTATKGNAAGVSSRAARTTPGGH